MSNFDLLKADRDNQCVWVSAGLLREGLCDRDFDCDHCPLHLALSKATARPQAESAIWPRDRLYSSRHFWLRPLSGSRARVGLTEMAAQLLHPVVRWNVMCDGVERSSSVHVQAELACGRALLSCPIRARECDVNPRLALDSLWPAADPWLSGYLFEFSARNGFEPKESWFELPQVAPQYAHHREMVHRALANCPSENSNTSAQDGGLPSSGLLTVVGLPAYGALLSAILRGTVAPPNA